MSRVHAVRQEAPRELADRHDQLNGQVKEGTWLLMNGYLCPHDDVSKRARWVRDLSLELPQVGKALVICLLCDPIVIVVPEALGLLIAGSPLSYWGGVHGRNPMRYSGGLLGGSWLTALTSDLGGGKASSTGACLVHNFENLNPANTLWIKQCNVYSN
jgi:Protein of unknown function (DUF3141)